MKGRKEAGKRGREGKEEGRGGIEKKSEVGVRVRRKGGRVEREEHESCVISHIVHLGTLSCHCDKKWALNMTLM